MKFEWDEMFNKKANQVKSFSKRKYLALAGVLAAAGTAVVTFLKKRNSR